MAEEEKMEEEKTEAAEAQEQKLEEQTKTTEEKAGQKATKPKKVNLVYGALLLHSAGKDINEGNMKNLLSASGASVEDVQIKALVAALEGVDIDEAISRAALPVATAAAPVASGGAAAEKEEESEEEKEAKAEEAAAGLSSLFG